MKLNPNHKFESTVRNLVLPTIRVHQEKLEVEQQLEQYRDITNRLMTLVRELEHRTRPNKSDPYFDDPIHRELREIKYELQQLKPSKK